MLGQSTPHGSMHLASPSKGTLGRVPQHMAASRSAAPQQNILSRGTFAVNIQILRLEASAAVCRHHSLAESQLLRLLPLQLQLPCYAGRYAQHCSQHCWLLLDWLSSHYRAGDGAHIPPLPLLQYLRILLPSLP